MLTPLVALMVAVVALVAIKLTGAVLPGRAIGRTELSGRITAGDARVGDTVMFLIGDLDIAPGTNIKVTRITSDDAASRLRLVGGRVYQKSDFDNVVPIAWQSTNGDRDDPLLRPSTGLVGSRLVADPTEQRFILLEYLVCAPGYSAIDSVNIVYSVSGFSYEQTLHVHFAVRDAQASDSDC
jgi:hypothetical protein